MTDRHRALLLLGVAASVGFVLLASQVVSGGATGTDRAFNAWLQARTTPVWRSVFTVVTFVGQGRVLLAVSAGIVAVLVAARHTRVALLWGAAQGGAGLLNYGLKLLFDRARPESADPALVAAGSLSFPSGHATSNLVFAFFGAYLLLRRSRSPWTTGAILVSAVAWVGLVGVSRLYLGDHYLSDVLGGYLVGVAWLSACVAVAGLDKLDHGIPTN